MSHDPNPGPELVYLHGTADVPRRVLVTGAAGALGRSIAPALASRGHQVSGFDRAPMPHLEDAVIGELTDRAAIDRATDGIDTVIHLAAYPDPADLLGTLLEPNVIGLHHVVESSLLAGAKRLVLASSSQVDAGHDRRSGPAHAGVRAPTNYYALTKLWAEDLGEMTARLHGVEVLAVRIAWFVRNPREAAQIVRRPDVRALYLSRGDAQRFFARAVEATLPAGGPRFHVLYAAGPDGALRYDMEPSRAILGYEPADAFPEGLPVEVPDPVGTPNGA